MKTKLFLGAVVALGLATLQAAAQTTNSNDEIGQLKEQLRRMQQQLEEQQRLFHQQIESLQKRLDSMPSPAPDKAPSPPEKAIDPIDAVMNQKLSQPDPSAFPSVSPASTWNPAAPIRLFGNANQYMNVSFDGLMAAGVSTANDVDSLQPGGHDPKERGFTLQQAEVAFDGAVDPYFRGMANILFIIGAEGETVVELEEAYLESLSLPANLQLKAGHFFTEFGRQNPTHPHGWDFVDQPLINNRLFGGDGQRAPGMRLSWLAPTPFYSEVFFALQKGVGETAPSFRNGFEGEVGFGRGHTGRRPDNPLALRDMVFTPRLQASWNLSDSQTLLAGASASFGANASGTDTDTEIYGVDFKWKWTAANQTRGFPFVSLQSEFMYRRYEAGAYTDDNDGDALPDLDLAGDGATIVTVPRERIIDYGLYGQLMYGFYPRWVAGFRGDYVAPERAVYEGILGPDAARNRRWRLSPNLTYYPTEFSKTRLQYNYDWRDNIGPDHSLWFQLEFLLGSHGAHKF